MTRYIAQFTFRLGLVLLVASCDRHDDLVSGIVIETPQRPTVEIRLLTQLKPEHRTHLTVDQLGNVYWVQENSPDDRAGESVMLTIGESGVPHVTRLSAGNILKEMGVTSPGGTGVIQDIRAAGRAIYFYFIGGQGRVSLACLGQYFPRTGTIRIVASTQRLADLSRMGASLALRGSLVISGPTMWLWLRHSDLSTFICFDPGADAALTGAIGLQRPFEQVTIDGHALALEREDLKISTGFDGTLLILDESQGVVWEIDPFGRATTRLSVRGMPDSLTPPVLLKIA